MTKIMCNNIVLLASLIKAELQENGYVVWADVELQTVDDYKKCGKKAISFKGTVELPSEMIYFYVTLASGQLIISIERTKQIDDEISCKSPDVKNLNDGEKIIITKHENTIKWRKIYPKECHKIPFTVYKNVNAAISLSRNIVEILLK